MPQPGVLPGEPPAPEPFVAPAGTSAASPAAASAASPNLPGLPGGPLPWVVASALLLAVLAGGAVTLAWNTQQRVKALETELVRRQQDSTTQATEARALAREASEVAREAGARAALLEARLAETALQRTQLDDLVQSMARSRDDAVLAEIESALRVALQQSAVTGSAQPLVLALSQAEERLARFLLPRMEQVKSAVARDLEAARAAGGADLGLLALRLDEALRSVDELPLLAQAQRSTPASAGVGGTDPAPTRPADATPPGAWRATLSRWWAPVGEALGRELRGLVRVSRIDRPEALLVAPDQAFFLRENLKLRLLNARLALLSRQFDAVQADLAEAQDALTRWFDPEARRVLQLRETLQQVAAQAQRVELPRAEATLAAIATTTAGR